MENNSSFLRKIVVVLLILLFFVLQCSVFNSLAMGGIIPNLMIILTSSFGFMRGEKEGLLIGFSCGLLCDIYSDVSSERAFSFPVLFYKCDPAGGTLHHRCYDYFVSSDPED